MRVDSLPRRYRAPLRQRSSNKTCWKPSWEDEKSEIPDTLERWTAKRRVALVLERLRGGTTAAQAARKYSLTIAEIEGWKEAFLSGAENALRSRPRDEEAMKEAQIKKLKQKVGELVMERDVWPKGNENPPFRR